MAFGTFVQSTDVSNVGASPTNLAYASNVTAGDLLIAIQGVVASSGTPAFGLPTDTQGNTWVAAGTLISVGGFGFMQFFYCLSALATGANTVSFTNSGATLTAQNVAVGQYGGSPTAVTDGFQQLGSSAAINTVTGPTTTKPDLVLLLGSEPSAGATVSVSSGGFTLRSPSSNKRYAVADLTNVAPGLQSGGVNWNAAVRNAVAILAISATFSISGNAGSASATVAWSGASSGSTTADGSGNYTISNLIPGSYTITPSKTGFTFSPTNSNQTVTNANITGVNFTATGAALTDTISNGVCKPAMIYGRAPNGVLSAVTTDGNGNIDLSGQAPSVVDTIGNGIPTAVMIYGRAPNGQLQAVQTDGDGHLT